MVKRRRSERVKSKKVICQPSKPPMLRDRSRKHISELSENPGGSPKKIASQPSESQPKVPSTKGRPKKTIESQQKLSNNEEILPKGSSPETSPFKGFDSDQISGPQLFQSFIDNSENHSSFSKPIEEEKNGLFDQLLNDCYKSNFSRNIKTYSNKNKKKENVLLRFENCKSRDDVLKWLNDTRNAFDRVTQTQPESVPDNCSQVTLDMPSVSQKTPKVNKSTRQTRKTRRSPYKLRARSLDIQIKKNVLVSRNKRHSLAGDSPEFENYPIENVTDEEGAVPTEEKVIIDLMEDEYLDNIEKEIMQHEEKKSGWDRIKDINKSICKKKPKQLDIVFQDCQNNNKTGTFNSDVPIYDYDEMELYFVENMEKLMHENDGCIQSNHSNSQRRYDPQISMTTTLDMGRNFLTLLKKLKESEGNEVLRQFEPLMSDLRQFFYGTMNDTCTQTCAVRTVSEMVQTEVKKSNIDTQTEVNLSVNTYVQTEIKKTINIVTQTELNLVNKGIQNVPQSASKYVQFEVDRTIEDVDPNTGLIQKPSSAINASVQNNVQIENLETNKKLIQRQSSGKSTTPSDLLCLDDEEKKEITNAFTNEEEKGDEFFGDDIFLDFNTEDILQSSTVPKTASNKDSVLVVSTESHEANKGTKRQPESPLNDPGPSRSKRPCAEFIKDVSVEFSTCYEEEEIKKEERLPTPISLSDESDEEYERLLAEAFKVEESKFKSKPSQEQIKQIEEGRPKRSSEKMKIEDDMDYFKPSSYVSFRKVRRDLFDSKKDVGFSESIFESDKDITVITNCTLTKDNVDKIAKEENELDLEVENILSKKNSKVKILEDVIIKKSDTAFNEVITNDNSSGFSDVDLVESTPQKSPSSNFFNERRESVLDVTLPPPIEFQDSERIKIESPDKIFSPPRRPLAVINKITSTPFTHKPDSESFLSLSPIPCHGTAGKQPAIYDRQESKKTLMKATNKDAVQSVRTKSQENKRSLGPYESAQQQFSKFCPLAIIKKPPSQQYCTPKQKSILNYVKPLEERQNPSKPASFEYRKRIPCIACSRLSKMQMIAIMSLANKKLATYSSSFTSNVTHMIVAINEKNLLVDHTIKYVSAVAAGIWVLNFSWIQQCLLKNTIVPEEPYEVLDVSGQPGPQTSRLTRLTKPLLKGYKVHAAAPFDSITRPEVENIVRLLGGKVVPSPEYLVDKNGYVCLIITEPKATQDQDLYQTWLEALKVVTVDVDWLCRSVGQYRVLSLRPYTLCSDETIEKLGYPPELTANVTYSFSQQSFSSEFLTQK